MFENIIKFFKNIGKKEEKNNETENSKDAAKERLHLVLMQDRANVSARAAFLVAPLPLVKHSAHALSRM